MSYILIVILTYFIFQDLGFYPKIKGNFYPREKCTVRRKPLDCAFTLIYRRDHVKTFSILQYYNYTNIPRLWPYNIFLQKSWRWAFFLTGTRAWTTHGVCFEKWPAGNSVLRRGVNDCRCSSITARSTGEWTCEPEMGALLSMKQYSLLDYASMSRSAVAQGTHGTHHHLWQPGRQGLFSCISEATAVFGTEVLQTYLLNE